MTVGRRVEAPVGHDGEPVRVCVVGGAGAVGAATAAALLGGGFRGRLELVDTAGALLAAQVMDLRLVPSEAATVAAVPLGAAGAADVVVLAASVPHRDGAARADFLWENAVILEQVLAALPAHWPGTLVLATNPVDPLCTLAARSLPAGATVLGYTLNDSLRLRRGVALALGVHRHRVSAWAVGEHGPHTVPLFDRVRLDGRPVPLDAAQRDSAAGYAREWYGRWQRLGTGRTSSWASGAGIAALVRAVLADTRTLLPVSAALHGEYGLSGLSLGVPALVGAGRAEVVEWELTRDQLAGLRTAAGVVAAAVGGSGGPRA
ncbi:hypothetical protein ACFQ6N_26205 [Kitasatospora sp. NPDC056446]|uniref:lactate/malate family dehydrogenase n=1 Tax=Kitasatospora sp. NPDC056446 TaxID=3345819 RepID=UPI0036786D99